MRVYIKRYDLDKRLPSDVYSFCFANNYGGNGWMRGQLDECISKKKGSIFLAHDGNEKLGWCMAFPESICTMVNFKKYRKFAYFWVLPRHRKKGVGTRLVKRVREQVGYFSVEPGAQAPARALFKKNRVKSRI